MTEAHRDYRAVVEMAYRALGDPSGDPSALPEPHRSIVLVDTCLGLIENGGVEYLFQADLPHRPSYPQIAQAFRNCGAMHAASCLEQAASLLPGPDPHRHPTRRLGFLASPGEAFRKVAQRANVAFWDDYAMNARVVRYADSFPACGEVSCAPASSARSSMDAFGQKPAGSRRPCREDAG